MTKHLFYWVITLLIMGGCSSDENQTGKPSISMDGEDAFPQNCVTLYRGESFEFNAIFTDEQELGSFNIEIHNNFDHHTHSTDAVECELGEKKTPVNPFVYNKDFSIPAGQTSYQAKVDIEIPEQTGGQAIDTGDYHFMVRVTNKAGWQEIKGISVKIAER